MPRVYICPECGEKAVPSVFNDSRRKCKNVDGHVGGGMPLFPAAHWPKEFVRDEPSPEVEMARNPAVQRLVAKALWAAPESLAFVELIADGKFILEIPND